MNDKSNILATLMAQQNKQARQTQQMLTTGPNSEKENTRPTSGLSSGRSVSAGSGSLKHKQHKLKQRFTVIRKLGKGTYGKVQLAINKETQQEVAIKTIKKTKIENEQDLERVRREIQIMSSIEHPHIIHIYEVFENKDKIVLVMQYAPGGELYEYVSQLKVLNDQEARRIFRQIATAIFYCHQNKICHRDLKLENILLDEKNNAKLADFGLSNVFDKQRQLKTFCGSPLYASPEIVQGSPYEGPEVDCWSLGVLLYTLVYGAMPFDGSNFKRLVKQISEASYFEPKQRSQASPLIRSLLCADPNKRATILDICSDPWVNGLSPLGELLSPTVSSPSSSPGEEHNTAKKAKHTPLLKVAQDMANLTPVRLDILLALLPGPAQEVASAPEKAAPETNTLEQQASQIKKSARRSSVVMDVSIMNVEENTRASPVASYVARDLAPRIPQPPPEREPEKPQEILEAELLEQCESVKSEQPMEIELSQADAESSMCDIEVTVDGSPKPESVTMQVDSHSADPVSIPSDMAIESEPIQANPTPTPEEITSVQMEPGSVETSICNVPSQEQELIESLDEKVQQQVQSEPVKSNESEGLQEEADVGADEKLRKAKKKIVIKKKKVVRRKDSSAVNESTTNEDKTTKDLIEDSAKVVKKSTRTKGPRKVKIPDTFQAKEEEFVDKTEKVESRRQSALIADVSKKLLQQLQASEKSTSTMKVDQTHLTGVRVSEKKDEFERRSSLVSPTSGRAISRERELVECVRELLTVMSNASTAIIEPVRRVSPEKTSELVRVITDSITSMLGAQKAEELKPEAKADIERCLSECVRDFELACGSGEQQLLNVANIPDDRSDSVETIKAEVTSLSAQEFDKNVQSTFSINLSSPTTNQASQKSGARLAGSSTGSNSPILVSQAPPMLPQGPAPITRSYKKVTFTKDGACITETGKIYSTQADDGTIRRIERKSKITHYGPSQEHRPTSGERQMIEKEEEEEEIVYEEPGSRVFRGEQPQQPSRHGRFEKLIMPSSEFMFTDSSGSPFVSRLATNNTEQPTSSFPRSSAFGRERADSASSCSSNSTDVFDDIFDQWTGAMNMFEQHESIFDRNSPFARAQSKHQHLRKFGRMASSLAGSPRCGSAEPKLSDSKQSFAASSKENRFEGCYDSLGRLQHRQQLPKRPSSGMGNFRRMFDSGNLFEGDFKDEDPFFRDHEDPFISFHTEAMRRHEKSLRQRLRQQQRQLWKGSTPSLFDQDCSSREANQELSGSQSAQRSREDRSSRASASSFPLQPTPIRDKKRTVGSLNLGSGSQLPPRMAVQTCTSKASIQQQSAQKVATFIKINRTSSSSANSSLKHVTSGQLVTETSKASSSKVVSQSGSSSRLWNSRLSPSGSANIEQQSTGSFPENVAGEQFISKQENESRIQSWLQNSIGNLSGGSSGFKSSASDATTNYSPAKETSFSNMKQPNGTSTLLPPSGSRRIVTSSANFELTQPQERQSIHRDLTVDSLINNDDNHSEVSKATSSSSRLSASNKTTSASFSQQQQQEIAHLDSQTVVSKRTQVHQEQQVLLTRSSSKGSAGLRTAPVQTEGANLEWVVNANPVESMLSGSFEEMSIGVDRGTEPPSSLLEQLRSRGYKSMINQRIVSCSRTSSSSLTTADQQPSVFVSVRSGSSISSNSTSNTPPVIHRTQVELSPSITERSSNEQQEVRTLQESSTSSRGQTKIIKRVVTKSSTSDKNDSELAVEEKLSGEIVEAEVNGTINPRSGTQTGSAELEEQREQEAKDDVKGDEEEEEDEDVKEAKANIRSHLERAKEMDLFLKSMQKEEEEFEKQRQQLFLFNNLMLSTKLNGLCKRDFKISSQSYQSDLSSITSGAQSAPIRNNNPLSSLYDSVIKTNNNINIIQTRQTTETTTPTPSAALSFEPTFTLGQVNNQPLRDPLEPIEPYYVTKLNNFNGKKCLNGELDSYEASGVGQRRNRSRSQFREAVVGQFGDQPMKARGRCFGSSSYLADIETKQHSPPVRGRRSLSQIRYPTGNSYSSRASTTSSTMVSEYRSAYGAAQTQLTRRSYNSSIDCNSPELLYTSGSKDTPEWNPKTNKNDSDSDDGMSAYRASTYVPKVVPQGLPTERVARRACRESTFWKANELKSPASDDEDKNQHATSAARNSVVSLGDTSRDSQLFELNERRYNLSTSRQSITSLADNSRLSELEQRIQENKKRREELLASNMSIDNPPKPTRRLSKELDEEVDLLNKAMNNTSEESNKDGSNSSKTRQQLTGSSTKLVSRPSRLESMQARIKRKSYCIRLGDYSPERGTSNKIA